MWDQHLDKVALYPMRTIPAVHASALDSIYPTCISGTVNSSVLITLIDPPYV